jgi:hypothetical protein
LPPLRKVMSRIMIIVFLALLNSALGTIGYGAYNSQMKKDMMKTMPIRRGAMLCALPHAYCYESAGISFDLNHD